METDLEKFGKYINGLSPVDFDNLLDHLVPNSDPANSYLANSHPTNSQTNSHQTNSQTNSQLPNAADFYILQCIYEIHGVDLCPLLHKVPMETILSLYDDNMTYLKLIDKLLLLYYHNNKINKQDEQTIVSALSREEDPANICNFIIACINKPFF